MRRIATAALSRTRDRVPARAVLVRPPSGPSCSRWLSCSCCRHHDARQAPRHEDKPKAGDGAARAAPFRLGATQTTNSAIPPLASLQHMQMPHLPLPPPLPWSPDSAPFLRHIQILSLALLSPAADESWEVYEALHPDLRPAIPDDVFISLLAHQLDDQSHFDRVMALLLLGRECGMNPYALSASTMGSVVDNLLRTEPGTYSPERATMLDWLWPAFVQISGDSMANISLSNRRRWLDYMMFRHKQDCQTVFAEVERMVEEAGPAGMDKVCTRVVVMYSGRNPELHRTALRLATWCLARDIDIPELSLRTIVSRLGSSLGRGEADAAKGVSAAVDDLIEELVAGGADFPAQRLREVRDWYVASQRSSPQKGRDVASDPTATMPKIHRAAQRILKKKTLGDEDWDAVVGLCLRALKFKDADYEALLRISTRRLSEEHADPRHIIRIVDGIILSGILKVDGLSPQLVTRLFYAVIGAIKQDPEAYNLAYRLYSFARSPGAGRQGQQWLKPAIPRWLTLFYHAVSSGKLHFASRLYADLQADGRSVPRHAQLAFIRKIAETQFSSRRVLLDRHIKDYLWEADVPTEPLVIELCRGLSHSPDDAALAISLSRRIQPATPLPPSAIMSLVTPLLTSARVARQKQGMALLADLPASEASRPAFHAAMAALSKNVASSGMENLVHVYHAMIGAGLRSDAETTSLVLTALLKTGNLESAMATFDGSAEHGFVLHPAPVAALMTRLALAGRIEDAYDVESKWRSSVEANSMGVKIHGMVYGARLLVDIKAGRPVNLAAFVDAHGTIVEHEGWKPTRPFFRWLEREQHEQRGDQDWTSVLAPGAEVEVDLPDIEAITSEAVEEEEVRQPVKPVTQSLRTEPETGQSLWLEDEDEVDVRRPGVGLSGSRKQVVSFA